MTTLSLIKEDSLAKYDQLIDSSKEGTIFHKSWWLYLYKNYYYKYNIKFYGLFEGEKLVAAIPISIQNRFGMNFIYPPKLTPYLGPVFLDIESERQYTRISKRKKINKKIAKLIMEEGFCLSYPFIYGNVDLQPYIWHGFSAEVRYTYILKLENLDSIWANMERKRRHEIIKARKNEYNITVGDIRAFCKLNDETMKRQKHGLISPTLWMSAFNESKKHNCGEIFTIFNDDSALASLFLVWDNKRSYYIGGGMKNGDHHGLMSLLICEAARYTWEELHLKEFDFEGSGVPGIEHYFRKFGGALTPVYYIRENSLRYYLVMGLYNCMRGQLMRMR